MSYLKLMGYKCRDVVTGFEGVAESISYDLYGCIQIDLRPSYKRTDDYPVGRWFDAKRVARIDLEKKPVMEWPEFDDFIVGPVAAEAGAADLPSR